MRKKKLSYIELVRRNKEELLKNPDQLEVIEKRLEKRHEKAK
ncbi:FbpB family small basic protein [Cytobacillus sp. FSL W7-1323]|uniref:FbpB family small basic protein n=2 Tax=Cytobacillus TaxID=2675230 RepID=A0A248TEY4_9BACI|nr:MULTISPECIES: FbpB family small basic protein [Cytobacillus]ASV66733.1 FbpB family small basic protein [Cytobacillus kochii]MBD7938245.1 FbpB family small basic protein [Cytobacillus stercorigallinarum]MCA1024727.1 FbpB family small basic protein [Cytobacillus kochii]MCM3323790.1 FbpB family small basic protein [Cytobacillus kochii]MCM3346029.1 FbpB family small basic protein [Cytobacillus kochii]